MTDMRIAIACQDPSLRALAYALVPDYDPANLLGITIVEDLIRAMNQGLFDVVVLDEGFEDPDRVVAPMVELYQARMPVVALMPRAPSFAEPASAAFERTALATRAVKLDLPSTAAGMEQAIRGAIDNREEAAPSGGPDYGRKRAFPAAWQEPEPDVNMDFGKVPPDQDPKSDPLAERPTPPPPDPSGFAPMAAEEQARKVADQITGVGPFLDARSEAMRRTVETIKEAPPTDQRTSYGEFTPAQRIALAQREKAKGIQGGAPAEEQAGERSEPPLPPPAADPMDALIEAAKAIVVEASTGKGGYCSADTGLWVYPMPKDLLKALADALDDAGYAPW